MTDCQVDTFDEGLHPGEHWSEVVATSASIDGGGFPDLAVNQNVASEGKAHGDGSGDHSCGFCGDCRRLNNWSQRAGCCGLIGDSRDCFTVSAGDQGETRENCGSRDEATKVHMASLVMDE